MRGFGVALAVLTLAAATAAPDEVAVGGMSYSDVRIKDVQNCKIVFRTASGSEVSDSLKNVSAIKLTGREEFNRAEEMVSQPDKISDALQAYGTALQQAKEDWLKKLIRHRLLRAQEEAGLVRQALETWLAIVGENEESDESLALAPQKLGAKGSPENAKAIEYLKELLQKEGQKKTAGKNKDVLLKLYQVEGRQEEAVALARNILPGAAPPATPGGQIPASPSGSLRSKLDAVEVLLQQGQAEEVLKQVQASLPECAHADLSKALLLLGKAQVIVAKKDPQQGRQYLLQAGLNFMRVKVFFGNAAEAPEALLLAGEVSAELGNAQAALRAYQEVMHQYGESPFARQAKEKLARMEKGP